MNRFETGLATFLWRSRLVVIVAVLASLVVSLVLFYITSVDVVYIVGEVRHYADPGLTIAERGRLHGTIVAHAAAIFDGYLFAAILVIFALGLYELFVGKIHSADQSEAGVNVLLVRDLDDLKERLAKVVFLILVVRYFEYALELQIDTTVDLLYLAVGIGLIALAIFLASRRAQRGDA
jgi:uncharacterized membrane protein YqhA